MATKQLDPPVTRTEILQVVKAVRDEVKGMIGQKSQEFETQLSARIAGAIQREFGDKLLALEKSYEDKLSTTLEQWRRETENLVKSYDIALQQLLVVVKSLPTPTVNLPAESINVLVKAEAPTVNVNVPENAIQMSSPTVNVSVPTEAIKMMAPTVNVTVPEQAPPQVQVNVPQRKMIKTISYDEQNRPSQIIEQEG